MSSRFFSMALFIAACGSHNPGASDAALPVDAAPATITPDADLSAEMACEASLAAAWATAPPTMGMGSPTLRQSYEGVLGQILSDYQVPGAAVAVAKDGKL